LMLGQALLVDSSPSRNERLRALWAYRRATELAPGSTEVWYRYGMAGFRFGNADGERVARIGLLRVLAVDPLYEDAWQHWLVIYRSDRDRRDMRALLAPHASNPRVAARIALLLIEEGRYAAADSTLGAALAHDSTSGSLYALAAQSAFEGGRPGDGERHFDRALAFAGNDPEDVLWAQALGVASAAEISSWNSGIASALRSSWLASFWWRRSSNLFDGIGARVSEHFQRLRLARHEFTLTQPLFDYQRDQQGRALHAAPSAAEQVFYQRCEARWFPGGSTRLTDEARAPDVMPTFDRDNPDVPGHLVYDAVSILGFGATHDASQLDSGVAMVGIAAKVGLDDRGLLLLRYGPPRTRTIGSPNTEDRFCAVPSLEHWDYAGLGTMRFFRPEDVSILQRQGESRNTGSVVMRPMNDHEFEAFREAYATDRTSAPAGLRVTAWFAAFPTDDASRNRIYAITSADTVAFALTGTSVIGPAVAEGGITVLDAPVGRYQALVHARSGVGLGRIATPFALRDLGAAVAFCDLLVAEQWSLPPSSRQEILAHASRTLRFQVGQQMRVYGELVSRREPRLAHYRVRYELIRTDRPVSDSGLDRRNAALSAEYPREVTPARSATAIEWVDISLASELAPGNYLLRVTIFGDEARVLGRSRVLVRLYR